MGAITFEAPDRYTLIRPIGQGSYGLVVSAWDNTTGEKVAIKKVSNIMKNDVDCKRTLREMLLLKHFIHENVISMRDVYISSKDGPKFNDVYVVTELMDTDLHQILSSEQGLSPDHCQFFIYQILRALKYIHEANVLHRDLKPSNILLNGDCDLRVCDFGLARVTSPDPVENNYLTFYVATRWYRAPEIILSMCDYDSSVDVWSVGCVIAEILGRRPVFPGRDYLSQMQVIVDIIGTPSEEELTHISSPDAKKFVRNLQKRDRIPFGKLFPKADPLLIDLLERTLQFDPKRRIGVDEALKHPYLNNVFEEDCMLPHVYTPCLETHHLNKQQVRNLIWHEIVDTYHPEIRELYPDEDVMMR